MRTVIVGGGILGLMISRHVQGSVVVEKGEVGGNSAASLWTVVPNLCLDRREVCQYGLKAYVTLSRTLGFQVEERRVIKVGAYPTEGVVLGREELRVLEPYLEAREATLGGKGVRIEGEEALKELREGVDVQGDEVIYVEEDGSGVRVVGRKSSYPGDYVVITAGFGSALLLERWGIKVDHLKGHVIRTGGSGLNSILLAEGRIAVEGKGGLVIGGDSIPSTDPSVDQGRVRETLEVLSRYLKVGEVREVRVGFRTVIEGPLLRRVGRVIIAGGYRFGIAAAPYIAREVRDELRKLELGVS